MYLKEFQEQTLEKLDNYLNILKKEYKDEEEIVGFRRSQGRDEKTENYCKKAWDRLHESQKLPVFKDSGGNIQSLPYRDKKDGNGDNIPNICLKVPTGGGKTLLGIFSIDRINADYFSKKTGLVLWIVPTDAIYRQTIQNFKNRDHPYRKSLERFSAGRVKILEKTSSFSKQDLNECLCIMVIMLQSANRETKESLRIFKDSGRFIKFFPKIDDIQANNSLLNHHKNLDVHTSNAILGSLNEISIKHSLGNAIRITQPIIILDEGHRAYSELARNTLSNLNPRFILELSATPNMKEHLSNILVSVSGVKLKEEEMIKLPINITNSEHSDWKQTLCQSYEKLKKLEEDSTRHYKNSKAYIRPIMLIQVERTGRDQRDKKFIHSEDAREYLQKTLGISESAIKVKVSGKDEIKDENLLSETSKVKFIITKQALQEGWDCPFAYVLTILSNMQSKKALTQLIGRILRQPYAQQTSIESLNECYIFCYNNNVQEIVEGIRKGLQQEGMDDLVEHLKVNGDDRKKVKSKRTERFQGTQIFLPRVLHKENNFWRSFIYEQDLYQQIDFAKISYRKKDQIHLDDSSSLKVNHIKLDIENQKGQFNFPCTKENSYEQPINMDFSYMVRRLTNTIPNPWQASRILGETFQALQLKGISDEIIYLNRKYLLNLIEIDLQDQVNEDSEKIFRKKLKKGDICFKIFKDTIEVNWEMADDMDFLVSDNDKILRKQDDGNLQLTLFEKTYQKHYNNYEKKVAWYLDDHEAVKWWHRMVAKQGYFLQGWQKRKIYPDFLACINLSNSSNTKFSVIESKGDHLKGNDDTEYKKKLFNLLEEYANNSIDVGTIETASKDEEKMVFKILMEKSWEEDIKDILS